MRQAIDWCSSGLRSSRLVWLALSSLVGIIVSMLVLIGEIGAQSAVPPFLLKEGTPPPGANIPCDPNARHPYPVVLVHGTFETMDQNWAVLSPRLKEKGYCVFALNYGTRGTGRIERSAQELGRFVDNVLEYTEASKVQLVGHSQGGMMPRYWIKYLDGRSEVEDLVGIAPSNYGTELADATSVNSTPEDWGLQGGGGAPNPCYACDQQGAESSFIRRLNNGDDTLGRGAFTQIATDDDEIIIPYTRCFLRGREHTRNIVLQRYNGGLVVTHQNIYNDPFVQKLVFDALANPGTAKPARAFD